MGAGSAHQPQARLHEDQRTLQSEEGSGGQGGGRGRPVRRAVPGHRCVWCLTAKPLTAVCVVFKLSHNCCVCVVSMLNH